MPFRLLIFLFGFGLTVLGLSYIILYLNLLSIGYSFWDYVFFIFKRIECINFLFGVILILVSVFFKGGKNELYLWYYLKF